VVQTPDHSFPLGKMARSRASSPPLALALAGLLLGPATAAARDPPLDTIRLPNGVVMPKVAAGTWPFKGANASAAVQAALSAGYMHVDTAYDYFNQADVGVGLNASGVARENVFITTKVPGCGLRGLGREDCYGNTLKLIGEDLRLLSASGFPTRHLDLLLVHYPPCMANTNPDLEPPATACGKSRNGCTDPDNCKAIGEQWRAVQAAYARGLVRAVGVSNYCRACFACLPQTGVQPMVNQVQLHVGMGPDPQGFASTARAREAILVAWGPFGHAAGGGGSSSDILRGELTTRIARAHNRSAAQVALKWIVSRGAGVVTRSGSEQHLAQDRDIFSWKLTAEELRALDAANFASADTPSFLCDDAPTAPSPELIV